jgi:hypothetical protein
LTLYKTWRVAKKEREETDFKETLMRTSVLFVQKRSGEVPLPGVVLKTFYKIIGEEDNFNMLLWMCCSREVTKYS